MSGSAGHGKRVVALLVILGLEAVLIFAWRPDRALWSDRSMPAKGPRTTGAETSDADWSQSAAARFLQTLAAYDWYVAVHIPDPQSTIGATDAERIALFRRVFGFDVDVKKVSSLDVVVTSAGQAVVVGLSQELDDSAVEAQWKDSAKSFRGLKFRKASKPESLLGAHAMMPNGKVFLVGTNEGVLRSLVQAAAEDNTPLRDAALSGDKPALVLNRLLGMRSRFQSQSMGASESSQGKGVLAKFRFEDWCRDVDGGTVIESSARKATLNVQCRDAATAKAIAMELSKLASRGGAKIEGEKLTIEKSTISGQLELAAPLADSLLRLLESK